MKTKNPRRGRLRGKHILRKVRYGGAYVQIIDYFVNGKGSTATTVGYTFVDGDVRNRRTYQYKLIEVETSVQVLKAFRITPGAFAGVSVLQSCG